VFTSEERVLGDTVTIVASSSTLDHQSLSEFRLLCIILTFSA
jgi:hypothetical protein